MKGKRQRKRNEENQPEANPSKSEQRPLKIKFEICKDSIACFIGERKSTKRRTGKGSASLKKAKPVRSSSRPPKEEAQKAT
jgi:hypothetical protein